MPKHLIVTTCGTSILTNVVMGEDAPVRDALHANTNCAETAIAPDALSKLRRHIAARREQLLGASIEQACRISAELNGLLNFYGRQMPLPAQDVHVLIHTDTWLGHEVAELLSEKLKRVGATPQMHCAQSLNTADFADFQAGLGNLVEWAAQTLPGYRDSRFQVVFNLVGGFKSLQGFMQTLGMFYADEILYIFEGSDHLLRIPRLPVNLDSSAREIVVAHLATFRLLEILKVFPTDNASLRQIPESFLYRLGNETEVSPWGKIVWNQTRRSLYEQKLHEAPTGRITFAERFRTDAADLPPDRLAILNTRIDDLTRLLLDPTHPNPKRLDLKRLGGNPMPPSDHECDAWADADCRRIFLRYDGSRAVLDRVTDPLH